MNKKYDPKKIEPKWQKFWQSKKSFEVKNTVKGKKKMVLVEFPYPSGAGLHMGHMRPFIAGDVTSKYFKMNGFNTMYPIGWDAFGLPAENYAIKNKVHPRVSTAKNVANAKKQLLSWGTGYDWSREINTTDPEYYKWTQKLFLEFYDAGLAYEKFGEINWCPKDKTGLANEEVVDGKCDRCGTVVEKKNLRQWYLKITDYAEKLLEGLKDLKEWPEPIKLQQENWIGKSEGAEIDFQIVESYELIKVFTTRADTLFGVTYLVLAPENDLVKELKSQIKNWSEAEKYINDCKNKSDIDRTSDSKEKTGVELKGVFAINPANNEKIPVWIADYVLASYGTGAIMAVPAHDERDFEFAKKYNLEIRAVVEPLFPQYSGDSSIKDGIEFQNREVMCISVRNPNTNKYLGISWKSHDMKGMVTGGIEDEEVEIAARREVLEETGYKNLKLNFISPYHIHTKFYHRQKNVNRHARWTFVTFDLINEEKEDVSEYEKKLHDVIWINDNEILNYFSFPESIYNASIIKNKFGFLTKEGYLVNSNKFNGLTSEEAKSKITEFVGGRIVTKYKLRDWVFSRQRYWGEPIPLIRCGKCGVVPVPEKDLPVVLPKVKNYEPTGTGESPLAAIDKWVNVKCPKCKGKAKRETNTMPQWAGSSWYWLRYMDPKNKKTFADRKIQKYWSPVDLYFGGMEHTTLHLLYSRFWNLFFYDRGLVTVKEPYKKRVPHGIILGPDGEKMSKSRGNVVNPDDVIKIYGADTTRLYMMFLGPHGAQVSWNDKGIVGTRRFLERVFAMRAMISKAENNDVTVTLHKTIKKVTEDIETFSFNTAVSTMMIFVNTVYESKNITKKSFEAFLQLLAPFAPHMTEELWNVIGNKKSVYESKWPKYKEELIRSEKAIIAVQINGKTRAEIEISQNASDEEVQNAALVDPKVMEYVGGKGVKRVIVVKNRLINIVLD